MDHETPQVLGWRSFRFGFGKGRDQEPFDSADQKEVVEHVCTTEACGDGCYLKKVDFDTIDQN